MPNPYTPVPTVAPEEARRTAAIPEIHEEVPHVTFTRAGERAGEALGEATRQYGATMSTVADSIRSLGRAVSGAGDEMFTRALALKQLESEKTVNDATVGYEMSQLDRDEKFKLKEGTAADSTALKAHMEESNNARLAIKNTMTPNEQRMFDTATTGQYIRSMREAGHHAAQQTKAATSGSIEAVINTTTAGMGKAIEDSDFKVGADQVRDLVYGTKDKSGLKQLHGWTDEQADMEFKRRIEGALAARISDFSLRDPGRAMQMLNENKDQFENIGLWDRTYKAVKAEYDRRGARNIADEADQKMPDASMADRDAFARERAQRDAPGDSIYRDAAVDRTRVNQRIRESELEEQKKRDYQTALRTANGYKTASGKKPMTMEDARVEPGFKEAYSNLDEQQRMHVDHIIDTNSKKDFPPSDETDAVYRYWHGRLTYIDPVQAAAEISANPSMINDLEIPRHQRNELFSIYDRVMGKEMAAAGDPKVQQGMKILEAAGFPSRIFRDKNLKPRFASVLGQLAEEKIAQTKKLPTRDEWVALGNQALHSTPGYGPFGLFGGEAYYKSITSVPSGFKADWQKTHPGASDTEVMREYVRFRRNEDLKGEEKTKVKTVPVRGQ